jgi:hypothetical protein
MIHLLSHSIPESMLPEHKALGYKKKSMGGDKLTRELYRKNMEMLYLNCSRK